MQKVIHENPRETGGRAREGGRGGSGAAGGGSDREGGGLERVPLRSTSIRKLVEKIWFKLKPTLLRYKATHTQCPTKI